MSWQQARTFCHEHVAHLASVGSAQGNAFLVSIVAGTDGRLYWTGINDIAVEGVWVWDSGEPVVYTQFGAGEPNNAGGQEDCATWVEWADGTWNDDTHSHSYRFICEWDQVF